jgi:hypothetical protein
LIIFHPEVARPSKLGEPDATFSINAEARLKGPAPLNWLQTRNEKASSRITPCARRRSHFYRAKFIPQLSINRRTIVSQIPAMTLVLF